MPEVHSNRSRRWLTAAIKLAIVVVVVWFIRRTLVNAWQELGKHPLHLNFAWLAASGGLYLLGSLLCGLFWHRVLRTLGQNVSLSIALRAYFIGHLGKYVPGKAMVVILRAGLVRGPGVEAPLAVVSVFFETLTMMSVVRDDGCGHCGRLFPGPSVVVLGVAGHDGRGGVAHAAARVPPAGADGRFGTVGARHSPKARCPGLSDRGRGVDSERRRMGYTWIELLGGAAEPGGWES